MPIRFADILLVSSRSPSAIAALLDAGGAEALRRHWRVEGMWREVESWQALLEIPFHGT